jgi:predicted Zn-dependent peptidase
MKYGRIERRNYLPSSIHARNILREISEVTPEQIKEIARQILPASPTLAVVGPFRSTSKFERLIK